MKFQAAFVALLAGSASALPAQDAVANTLGTSGYCCDDCDNY